MTSDHGRRSIPPALFVGFALPLAWTIARLVIYAAGGKHDFSASLMTASDATGFAMECLVIAGTLELLRRFTGTAAVALRIALVGTLCALASDVISGLAQLSGHWWEHKWIFKLFDYGGAGGWLVFAIGMMLAIPRQRRMLGAVAVLVTFLTWPTELLREHLYGWMHIGRSSEMYFHSVLYIVRCANLLGLALFVNAGTTTPDPEAAANGLKRGAKALWLRVVVALCVSTLTLMFVTGARGGSNGSMDLIKMMLIGQGVVSFIALAMFGAGMLTAARSAVPGLAGYLAAITGAASLWGAGVALSQFPHLYRMFYRSESSMMVGDERDLAQALAVAAPVVVTIGTALMATVLSRFAAFRGDSKLHTDAHRWGVGYVLLMLVAVAIQSWALPKAESLSGLAVMMLVAAAAGLWATILMARLLGSGADSLESDPSLPTASVVSGPS